MADLVGRDFTEKFDYSTTEAKLKPLMSTFHEEITSLDWAPCHFSDKEYDSNARIYVNLRASVFAHSDMYV